MKMAVAVVALVMALLCLTLPNSANGETVMNRPVADVGGLRVQEYIPTGDKQMLENSGYAVKSRQEGDCQGNCYATYAFLPWLWECLQECKNWTSSYLDNRASGIKQHPLTA